MRILTLSKFSFFILFIFTLTSCGDVKEDIHAEYSNLTESVYSSATVQPIDLYEVYASVNGIVDKLFVQEGQLVQRGAALVQIKNTAPQLNSQNAQVALQQARQNASINSTILGSIQDEISTARLNLKNVQSNFERQQKLWNQDIGMRAELDNRKLAYESAQNQLSMLQSKLKRTKSELNTALQQANLQYQSARSNATDFTVRSNILGKVYSINKKQGEIISPQMPIATIGDADDFLIELLIDEVDITKIQLDQKVILTLDAYDKKVFEARISKIYPSKNERNQTFKVEASFVENPIRLYPGLTGEANIIISEKEKVLSIPRDYLNAQNEVNTSDGLIKVKTGLQSLDRIEVLSGIDTNTKLLLHEK